MRSGALRHRLIVQQAVTSTDGRGQNVEVWHDVAHVWGEIVPVSGTEGQGAHQVVESATHAGRVRFTPGLDLTATHRLKLGDRVFDIAAPPRNRDERNREWLLDLREHST